MVDTKVAIFSSDCNSDDWRRMVEGIVNRKKSKWLVFGGYNPHKDNISNLSKTLINIIKNALASKMLKTLAQLILFSQIG